MKTYIINFLKIIYLKTVLLQKQRALWSIINVGNIPIILVLRTLIMTKMFANHVFNHRMLLTLH